MCVHVHMLAFHHYAEKGSDQRSPSSTKSIYMSVCMSMCVHVRTLAIICHSKFGPDDVDCAQDAINDRLRSLIEALEALEA